MFGVQSAPSVQPRTDRPNVVDLQYRWILGGWVGNGRAEREEIWFVPPPNTNKTGCAKPPATSGNCDEAEGMGERVSMEEAGEREER